MANSAQARKRARQATRRRARNASHRSTVRTAIKKVVAAIDAEDRASAVSAWEAAVPVIDKMAGKGILHRNKAARHKRRLAARIRALPVAAEASAPTAAPAATQALSAEAPAPEGGQTTGEDT